MELLIDVNYTVINSITIFFQVHLLESLSLREKANSEVLWKCVCVCVKTSFVLWGPGVYKCGTPVLGRRNAEGILSASSGVWSRREEQR